jgi:pilus assembly protein CpaB
MGLRANDAIMTTDLASSTSERRQLSHLIQPGMRGIAIRTDRTSNFGGLLRPGDRVDVLLTMEREGSSSVTMTLLQAMLVLAVGEDTGARVGDSAQRGGRQEEVTLSAMHAQAAVLAHAGRVGTLSLILRNPDETTIHQELPETTVSDILEPERRDTGNIRFRPASTDAPSPLPTPIPEALR